MLTNSKTFIQILNNTTWEWILHFYFYDPCLPMQQKNKQNMTCVTYCALWNLLCIVLFWYYPGEWDKDIQESWLQSKAGGRILEETQSEWKKVNTSYCHVIGRNKTKSCLTINVPVYLLLWGRLHFFFKPKNT